MPADLVAIIEHIRQGRYDVSVHATSEMEEDSIELPDLVGSLIAGYPEIVEDYPSDRRGASCLILAWMGPDAPLHVVIGYEGDRLAIVTVYRPHSPRWEEDFRTRRKP